MAAIPVISAEVEPRQSGCRPGRAGRRVDDEITIYTNGGGAHLDVMIARIILDASREAPASS